MAGGSAVRAGKAFVEVSLRDRVGAGLKRIEAKMRAFSSIANTIGIRMLGIGSAMAAPFIPAIKAASDMEETMSKFNTVFSDNASAIKKWADGFAGDVGRSKQQIASFMAGSQDLFVPLGFDASTAENLSKTITGLSIDLASFNNMADEDALRDLHAALTGSGEVMKKYGVIVNETAVKQEMLNKGIDPTKATQQQKVMARLAIIMRGTTAAQGDAIRTSGSFANQMKRLKGTLADVAVELGNAILPAVTSLVTAVTPILKAAGEWIANNKQLVVTIAAVAVGIGIAGGALLALGGLLQVAGIAIAGLAAVWGAAGFAMLFLPRMASRAVRGVMGAIGNLTASSRKTTDRWSASWKRASQTMANWRKTVVAEVGRVQAAFRSVAGVGSRIGKSLAAGVRGSVGVLSSISGRVAAGLQPIPGHARRVFSVVRAHAASFGRGFTGDIGFATSRASSTFWAMGVSARGAFDRIAPLAKRTASLIQRPFTAVAARIAPIWQQAVGRISASFASVRTAASTVATAASQQWQRVAGAAQQVSSRIAGLWQRLPVRLRGPLARIASSSVWRKIQAAGSQTSTRIASVTRSAMQRAYAFTQAAAIRTFTRIRRVGVTSMRAIGRAGMGIGRRMGGAFSAIGSLAMLAPAGGGIFSTLLMSAPLIMSAVGAIGAALAGLLSPVGLIAIAVLAGIAAWTAWTTSGQQTLGALTQVFGSLWSVTQKVFGGLSDALAAGDMKLAARILWAGLKTLWYTGVAELNKVWPTLKEAASAVWQQLTAEGSGAVWYIAEVWSNLPKWLTAPLGAVGSLVGTVFGWIGEQASSLVAWMAESFSGIGTALAGGDFALAAEIAWASIKVAFAQGMAWVTNTWTEFTTGLGLIFDGVITSIRQVWNNISTWIARQLLNLVGLIQTAVSKLAAIDPTGLSDKLKAAISFDVEGAIKILEEDSQRFDQGLDQAKSARDDERVRAMMQRIAETEARLAELRAAREDALKQANAMAGDESESPLSAAMAELEDALADASKAKGLFDADGAQMQFDAESGASNIPNIGSGSNIAGTFNAAIAGLLGRTGDDPGERTADAVESMDETLDDIKDELKTRPPLAFNA